MLAGFLAALRARAPHASFSSCVPFPLEPLRQRFPSVEWLAYTPELRARCIAECDVWLGLGGSPFQSAQSRWFVDHLVEEAAFCSRSARPMYFLGIGVQSADELDVPDIRRLCAQAAGLWTRDAASAERLRALHLPVPVASSVDLAHVFFHGCPPPAARPGRVTLVANFDYGSWPGQADALAAVRRLSATEHVWLAQESRPLPGAEHALFAALPAAEKARWTFASPESAGAPLQSVLARWPSGEWLVTSRYHAAIAGAWAGSRVVVVTTNEKLRAAARELALPAIAPDASEATVAAALASATVSKPPIPLANRALESCAAFVRSAVAHRR